jgi:hypothetical protein
MFFFYFWIFLFHFHHQPTLNTGTQHSPLNHIVVK